MDQQLANLDDYKATVDVLIKKHQPSRSLAYACCDQHAAAKPSAPAIIHEMQDGRTRIYSFLDLRRLSIRFGHVLEAQGIKPGDRVALFLGQGAELPIAMIACWRIGAIPVPIATVFAGPGLEHRLAHSACKGVVTEGVCANAVQDYLDKTGAGLTLWLTDGTAANARSFWSDIEVASESAQWPEYGGSTPAFIIYTSGTTGKAKGAVHTHAGWLRGAPCIAMMHGDLGMEGDKAWGPAEWTWIAGFSGLLLGFLYAGSPVVAWKMPNPFDPGLVLDFLSRKEVRNTVLTPTMVRKMRTASHQPKLSLRSLCSLGEPLTPDLYDYLKNTLGVTAAESYGLTECAPVTVLHTGFMPEGFGSLGLPVPLAEMKVVDEDGQQIADGEIGEIAVSQNHPMTFSGYWDAPEATKEKLRNGWLHTGDLGYRDDRGLFWYSGRNDDMIKSSGYRIGPTEIEARVATHAAVDTVAVVGLPDKTRGQVVSAVIKLKAGFVPSEELSNSIIAYCKETLERHEYPRRIEFMDDIPITVTGKVMRKVVKESFLAKG